MDNFLIALAFTLKYEGGYVNDPNDPGGETNKGITKAVYDNYRLSSKLPIQSIKLISGDEVHDIYYDNYWIKMGCDKLDNKLGISVFDCGVNIGPSRALKYLTQCSNDYIKFNQLRLNYYNSLVKVNPKLKIYINGWTNRVNALSNLLK